MGIPTDACAQRQRLHGACKSRGGGRGPARVQGRVQCVQGVRVHTVPGAGALRPRVGLLPAAAWGCTHWGVPRCLQCGACASRKRRACVYMRVGVCSAHRLPQEVQHSVMATSGSAVRSRVLCHTWDVRVLCVSHLCECVQSRTSACCVHNVCSACADPALMVFSATAATGLQSGGRQLGPRRLWGLSVSLHRLLPQRRGCS